LALFLLKDTPYRADYTVKLALAAGLPGAEAVFLQDGVYGATGGPAAFREAVRRAEQAGVKFYVLGPDLNARGVEGGRFEVIDYRGLLELVYRHGKTL